MRDYLGPIDAAQVQTELGVHLLTLGGTGGVHVNAPHLTVIDMHLSTSASLVSNGQSFEFSLLRNYNSRTGIWSTADNALQARLVNGSVADIVVLGKLPQAIVPAVRKFAQQNWALLLEDQRWSIHNDLGKLKYQLEHDRSKLEEKERESASVSEG